MRNRMFLTLILSLCMADFGAFAAPATRGNARGTVAANNAAVTTQSVPVAARAASRQKVANNIQTSNATSGNVAARAGKNKRLYQIMHLHQNQWQHVLVQRKKLLTMEPRLHLRRLIQ